MTPELIERITRLETRLAQLMQYLGADIREPNPRGGFFDKLKSLIKGD